MRSTSTRYGQTIYIPKQTRRAVRLRRHPLVGDSKYDEKWLQQLLFSTPEVLPVGDIDRAFGPAIPLCRELPTRGGGSVDIAYMSDQGRLSIVECKLWRNPEARRRVVSQILDYAKEISRWAYEDLDEAVRRATKRSGKAKTLFDLVREDNDTIQEDDFFDNVTRSLRSGQFRLLVVGDGIHEEVECIAEYLKQSAGIRFTFELVELAIFDMPEGSDGGIIVQPSPDYSWRR